MNTLKTFAAALGAWTALGASAALAQDPAADAKERIRIEVRKAVDEMLKAEEEKLVRSIDQFLKEEFGKLAERRKSGAAQPPPAEAKGRAYLGIRPIELSEDERQELGIKDDEGGVRVDDVRPGSPAASAGLEAGDVIVRIDGRSFEGPQALVEAIEQKSPGQKVVLTVIRNGERKELEVNLSAYPEERKVQEPAPPAKKEESGSPPATLDDLFGMFRDGDSLREQFRGLMDRFRDMPEAREMLDQLNQRLHEFMERFGGEAPPSAPDAPQRTFLGVNLDSLSEEETSRGGLQAGEGAYVLEVQPESPAAQAGLKVGDIIVRADGKVVRGPEGLREAIGKLKSGDMAELEILREGKRQTIKATLGAR